MNEWFYFYFFIHLWSVSAFNLNRLIRSFSSLLSGITKILFLRSRPNANSTAHIRKVLQLCSTQPIQTLQTTWRELKAKQLITQWIWLEICQLRRLQSVSCCTVRHNQASSAPTAASQRPLCVVLLLLVHRPVAQSIILMRVMWCSTSSLLFFFF